MSREWMKSFLDEAPGRVLEVVAVFGVAWAVIAGLTPLAGEGLLARQGVVWLANVAMLATVWLGLRFRDQGWDHFGLALRPGGARAVLRGIALSVVVFVAGVAAFISGAAVMANLVDAAQPADMGGYEFLRGNLPLLGLSLLGVWIVSSFGEEVIYRAFLITRIEELGGGSKGARWWGVVISAGVFGLAHFAWGPVGIVQTTLMGVALGASYLLVGRNLWVLILAHGYMDTLLLIQVFAGG